MTVMVLHDSIDDLIPNIHDLLQKAKKMGVDQIAVAAALEKGFSVNARMGNVDTLEYREGISFSVTVYHHKQRGTAHTSEISKKAMDFVLEKAIALAQLTSADPHAGLPEPECLAYDYPELDLYHPWAISPNKAIRLVIECENFARELDPRVTLTEGVSIHTANHAVIQANSYGFCGVVRSSEHSIHCGVVAEESGHKQRDDDYTLACDPNKLSAPMHVAKRAVEKAVSRLGARKLKTLDCPVLFQSEAAKSLLRTFVAAISGTNLYRGTSFLKEKKGERIFPSWVRIYQQPHLSNTIGSAPFDEEGVKTHNVNFVEEGILTNYVLSSYSARKLGLHTQGNAGGVFNLFMDASQKDNAKSFENLVAQLQRGVIVTELMGQGVNLVTGDYSRGASGYWVESGKIQYPIEEITIAGNLKDIFHSILAVGTDRDERGNIKTGSILIRRMTVAGA